MANRVGQQFGNYRLVELLGRGGFAEVYLGQHRYLNSYAALKVLRTSLHDKDEQQFLAEAQTLVRLRHPNIVRVLEFAVEQGTPVLVMDYAPRGTLRQEYPRGSQLPLATTLIYVKQVGSALQYAHNHNIIHRDIKPENMLLDSDQHLLLSDFGLALLAPSSDLLSTLEMAGTLPYTAPEQLRGKPCFASDQYALGVVTFELLCGKRPFEGNAWEIIYQHQSTAPPSLRNSRADLPTEIEAVVLRALAKNPQQRFASVQTFALALEHACRTITSFHDEEASFPTFNGRDKSRPYLPLSEQTARLANMAESEKSTFIINNPGNRPADIASDPGAIQPSTILITPSNPSFENTNRTQSMHDSEFVSPQGRTAHIGGGNELLEQSSRTVITPPTGGMRERSDSAPILASHLANDAARRSQARRAEKANGLTSHNGNRRWRVFVAAMALLTVILMIGLLISAESGTLAALHIFGTSPGGNLTMSPVPGTTPSPVASVTTHSSSPSPTHASPTSISSSTLTPTPTLPTTPTQQPTLTPTTTPTLTPTATPGFTPTYTMVVHVAQAPMPVDVNTTVSASCLNSEQLLSGGYYVSDQGNPVSESYPSASDTWTVSAYSGYANTTLYAYVFCLHANFSIHLQISTFTSSLGNPQTFSCPSGSVLTGGGFRYYAAIAEPSGNGWLSKPAFGGTVNNNFALCATTNLKPADMQTQPFVVNPQSTNRVNLSCPAGELLVGGGFTYDYTASDIYLDAPNGSSHWTVGAFNNDHSNTQNGTGSVVCVQVPATVY